MSIRFSKYVRIVSGVAGSSGVAARELIGRIVTTSELVSPDEVLEFADALNVGLFFGTDSDEYRRALFYFSYVSPSVAAPRRLSFSRYAPSGAAATVLGTSTPASLAALKTATAGALTFKFGDLAPVTVSGINLAAATSLANVAALVQTALNANADPKLSSSLVSFDAMAGGFKFSTGVFTPGTVAITSGASGANDLATAMGLLAGRRLSGVAA